MISPRQPDFLSDEKYSIYQCSLKPKFSTSICLWSRATIAQPAHTACAPPSCLPGCCDDSQPLNFTVTGGTICPTCPVIESSSLLMKHVVTGRREALDLFTSAARFAPRHGTWLTPFNQEVPLKRTVPRAGEGWGGVAVLRERMSHRY